MSSREVTRNDGNTQTAVRQAHDRVSTYLSHFSQTGSTWGSFGKGDNYVEMLKMDLLTMLQTVEAELQARYMVVEPTDFGT